MTRRTFIPATLLLVSALITLAVMPSASARADFGVNWTAQFFNNTSLSGSPVATATYPTGVNVNWPGQPTNSTGQPVAGVPADNFSVRFSSTQTFTQAGTYTFTVFMDDGARVIIDSAAALDKFSPPAAGQTFTFNRDMTAGAHTITLEFVEFGGSAILQFQWNPVGGAVGGTPVVGITPTFGAATTATVVGVKGLAVRTGPYLGATLVTVAFPGNAYAINGRSNDEGGPYTWYLITVGGHTGWSSGRYLQLNGDPNTIPIKGNVFETLDGAPATGAKAFPRAIMNIRRRPSIRSAILGQIPWGDEADLLNRTLRGDDNFWLQIRYKGRVGWIFAPFITVRGNQAVVPVR